MERNRSGLGWLGIVGWLGMGLAVLGCDPTRLAHSASFDETLEIYRVSDGKKALAVAMDERGNRAWGAMYESLSQGRANDDAMKDCTKNARNAGVEAPCWLFAVGDSPAKETQAACFAGKVNPRRCRLQEQHTPGP